ncbi:class I SAM-dependent methyltransferase [Croceivirga radicis]|uniref:class I SAM-dependent methyltransferase n=1 Tax=Croceivirga radicis TaxID=1929488 RepID=UPI000255ACF1|nr:class I SAM-dependent methyltransferase [Croceivirga radicis]
MEVYLETKDHSVTKESFQLLYDSSLDMLVTKPVPSDLNRYYLSEDYISHTDGADSIFEKLYQFVKRFTLKRKVAMLNKYIGDEGKLLDYGAGTGDFLSVAKSKGFVVSGVEPSAKARGLAKQKGVDLQDNLNNLKPGSFDCITLWHVLEHVPDLEDTIDKLVSLLKNQGVLIIAVPNFKSWDAKHYKTYWAAFDVPRHLWHFSQSSIVQLFGKHNLALQKTKPMYFDSFYVSMLSERYKGVKNTLIRGFLKGLYSNLAAMGSKEWSSHIYILKKAK